MTPPETQEALTGVHSTNTFTTIARKTKTFQDLPLELVELILSYTDPITASRFSCTCSLYFSLVYNAEHQNLWRSFFLDDYDDPYMCLDQLGERIVAPGDPYDWKGEIQRRERTFTVVRNMSVCKGDAELLEVLETLIRMATEIPPLKMALSAEDSLSVSSNLVCLIAYKMLRDLVETLNFRQTYGEELPNNILQALARLHTMFGLTSEDFHRNRVIKSRGLVYDMDNYTEESSYGPFLPGPNRPINWVHIRAVQHIMQIHIASPDPDGPVSESSMTMLPYCQASIVDDGTEKDWAGVEGTWSCMFCFVDHRDLIAYNKTTPRDLSMFDDPEFIEVFRAFHLDFTITKYEPNIKHPLRPTIHFHGHVDGTHRMFGNVSVAEDKTVRWTFNSGEQGSLIWLSQGVQIGSVQSSYGVLGTWTTVFHEEDDPIGPMWMRRQREGMPGDPMFH